MSVQCGTLTAVAQFAGKSPTSSDTISVKQARQMHLCQNSVV